MKKQDASHLKLKQLSAAILTIMATPAMAYAAMPATTQLPGVGTVVAGGSVTSNYDASSASGTITLGASATVIQWGGSVGTGAAAISASINTGGVAGFDIGSGASLTFSGGSSVLNIDASGNTSEILGQLSATGPLFVANANGIVVGSSATITAPSGLGLLNASLGSSASAIATSFAGGSLDLSFTGVTGGVNIVSGADLSGALGGGLLVAGADAVNVNFAGYKGATEAQLNIDGGIPATVSTTLNGANVISEAAVVATGSVYTYSSLGAPVNTTVTLGLGETGTTYLTTAPFSFNANSQVIVSGDLVNNGLIGTLNGGSLSYGSMPSQLEWTGTLTNNGTIETNTSEFLSTSATTGATIAYSLSSTGAAVPPVNGSFVNASGAVLNLESTTLANANDITNSGSIIFTGGIVQTGTSGSIINTGSISTNMAGDSTLTVSAGSKGSVSLGGIINFSNTANPGAYTLAVTAGTGINYNAALSFASTGSSLLTAAFTASNVTIASAINASSEVTVSAAKAIDIASSGAITVNSTTGTVSAIFTAGTALTVDGSVNVSTTHTNSVAYVDANLSNTIAPTQLTLGGSGSIVVSAASGSDSYVNLYANTTQKNKPVIVVDNGKITAGKVALAGVYTVTSTPTTKGSISSVSGNGSITTGNLTVASLLGNFNNAQGTNPLKNGFTLNAMGTSPMNVTWTTAGGSKQAINLNINGSAVLNANNVRGTSTNDIVSNAGSLVTPNAGSNLLIQSTGNLQVGNTDGNAFNFPGGIALVGNGKSSTITQDVTVYNGWSTTPVAFQGIFYTAPTVILNNNNFYTNASTWVNFSAAPNVLPTVFTLNFANGAYSYLPVPNTSSGSLVHQNNYTTLANTAAAGGNWVAQVNTTPISSLGQFVAASATTTTQK